MNPRGNFKEIFIPSWFNTPSLFNTLLLGNDQRGMTRNQRESVDFCDARNSLNFFSILKKNLANTSQFAAAW